MATYRILMLANVQGPEVIARRGIHRNLAIAANAKVLAIAQALRKLGHEFHIYSPGNPAERTNRWFGRMSETVYAGTPWEVPITYGMTVDNRYVRSLLALPTVIADVLRLVNRVKPNVLLFYNIVPGSTLMLALGRLKGLPVIVEYEDSACLSRESRPPLWKRWYHVHERLIRWWGHGCYAPSKELLDAIGLPNRLLLPGVIGEDVLQAASAQESQPPTDHRLRLVYAGGLDASKGIDRFMEAAQRVDHPLEIHVCGRGHLAETLEEQCRQSRHRAFFHGLLPREQLLRIMASADIGLNPHRTTLHEGGAWPFKVVEYLAACGSVLCSRSGYVPPELAERVFLYDGDEVDDIERGLRNIIDKWPQYHAGARMRRQWASTEFGPAAVAAKMVRLIENGPPQYLLDDPMIAVSDC